MPAAVITITKRGEEAGIQLGANKMRFFDVSADTGTYTTGGFQITAAQLGFTSLYFVGPNAIATSGTSGATANGVGITHAATSVTVQVYEAAATGLALLEKTSGEAFEANWTFRLMAIGQ